MNSNAAWLLCCGMSILWWRRNVMGCVWVTLICHTSGRVACVEDLHSKSSPRALSTHRTRFAAALPLRQLAHVCPCAREEVRASISTVADQSVQIIKSCPRGSNDLARITITMFVPCIDHTGEEAVGMEKLGTISEGFSTTQTWMWNCKCDERSCAVHGLRMCRDRDHMCTCDQ